MGLILEGEGDLADAAAHYRKAIAVFSRMPGYEEQAQVVQSRLCSVILRMARIDEARACIVEGLELWSVEGGEKDTVSGLPVSSTGDVYDDLGNLNLQLGDIVAGEKAYRTAAAIGSVLPPSLASSLLSSCSAFARAAPRVRRVHPLLLLLLTHNTYYTGTSTRR